MNRTKTTTLSLKSLALIQLAVGGGISLAGMAFGSLQLGASIALGAGLMLFNLLALAWSWQRLMAKKSIAWTVLIIVTKYAVLLGSIYYLAREGWFSALGAGIGISSFMVSALVMALTLREKT